MPAELRLTDIHWAQLRTHLLGDGSEHAAVLVCGTVIGPAGTIFTTRRVVPLTEDDLLDSGALHLSISPIALARIGKVARTEGATIVLCHSHPWPGAVRPSPLDLETEEELCGRVFSSRLAPRPVGALVLGPDSFSARLWHGGTSAPMQRLRIVGDQILVLPAPVATTASDSVQRQVLAWGNLGQTRIGAAHVAIVGAGGTGSHIALQLAHLGIGRLTLIDPDKVERSNLSRLVGATSRDVGRRKVDVIADVAERANADLATNAVCASVIDTDPILFADADIVVGATDGHGSRAYLTELAQQYLVPVVDLGVDVIPTDTLLQAGGQVRVLRPGRGCLHCSGMLDAELVREEYLSVEDRAEEQRRGYLRGVHAPAPAVIALNGVVASLATLEICQLLAGFLGSASDRLLYRAHRRALTTAAIPRGDLCYVCGAGGLLGLGDARDLPWRRTVVTG